MHAKQSAYLVTFCAHHHIHSYAAFHRGLLQPRDIIRVVRLVSVRDLYAPLRRQAVTLLSYLVVVSNNDVAASAAREVP